jgi:hypothetical protein
VSNGLICSAASERFRRDFVYFIFINVSLNVWNFRQTHGTARPGIADGGDSFQIWRGAVNIVNKHSRTGKSGWSFRLGLSLKRTDILLFTQDLGGGAVLNMVMKLRVQQ